MSLRAMPHAYTEDQLAEHPAIALFAELDWTTVSAMEGTFGANGTLLRETKSDVGLVSRMHSALQRRFHMLRPTRDVLPPRLRLARVEMARVELDVSSAMQQIMGAAPLA